MKTKSFSTNVMGSIKKGVLRFLKAMEEEGWAWRKVSFCLHTVLLVTPHLYGEYKRHYGLVLKCLLKTLTENVQKT